MKNFLQNTIQSQKVFYRYYRRKGWKRFFKENVLDSKGSNKNKALSIALGVFIGLTPLYGLHTVLVLFLASIFKLNKFLSYVFIHVSLPPLIPFLIIASLYVGSYFVPGSVSTKNQSINLEFAKEHLLQYVVGSMVIAVVVSVFAGALSYLTLESVKPNGNRKT